MTDPKLWDFRAAGTRIRLSMQSFLRGQASDPILAWATVLLQIKEREAHEREVMALSGAVSTGSIYAR